tara:strand:- start:2679 stop:3416 length:738 start_codon:yes stop_codon:yes gene_type:complete
MENRVCIVTGAGKGIGFQVAKDFILDKNIVYACTKSYADNINKLKSELPDEYSDNLFLELFDINDYVKSREFVQKIWKSHKRIDVLVNSVGVSHGSLFTMSTMSDMERIFKTNYFSIVHFMQICSKLMARKKEGVICNISSISAFRNDPGTMIYGSSKCALNFATKVIAKELGASNIRINSVAPGVTATAMLDNMDQKAIDKQVLDSALNKVAKTSDISSLVHYLCSEKASHITGQIIKVDGGQL